MLKEIYKNEIKKCEERIKRLENDLKEKDFKFGSTEDSTKDSLERNIRRKSGFERELKIMDIQPEFIVEWINSETCKKESKVCQCKEEAYNYFTKLENTPEVKSIYIYEKHLIEMKE